MNKSIPKSPSQAEATLDQALAIAELRDSEGRQLVSQ